MTTELKMTDKSKDILGKLPEVYRHAAVNYAISMLVSTDFYAQAQFVVQDMDSLDVSTSTSTTSTGSSTNSSSGSGSDIKW